MKQTFNIYIPIGYRLSLDKPFVPLRVKSNHHGGLFGAWFGTKVRSKLYGYFYGRLVEEDV